MHVSIIVNLYSCFVFPVLFDICRQNKIIIQHGCDLYSNVMSSLSRWVLRRQKKLFVIGTALFLFLCIYILTFHEDIPIQPEHFQPFSERCLTGSSKSLIDEVCRNYSVGFAFGGLCDALCSGQSIRFDDCIHHGSTYVLLGKYGNDEIVIKNKNKQKIKFIIEYFEEFVRQTNDIEAVRREFLRAAASEIHSSHGADSEKVFFDHITSISKLLFGKNISELSLTEMRNSWELIAQEELVIFALHQNLKSFPRLLGTCGSVYAMEKISPYSKYFPEVLPTMSWFRRVKIALGFLNLLKEFYNTRVGLLHHCDIQEGNFGLTKDLQVKSIDVDLILSPVRADEVLPQPSCKSDDECDFFDCVSKCNATTEKCTDTFITNNLQVVCRDIFSPQWPSSGLLSNLQPAHIKTKLNTLLKDCKSKDFGLFPMNHNNVWTMFKELENVLHESLQHRV